MGMSSHELQRAKQVVRRFHDALDGAAVHAIGKVFDEFTSPDLLWRGVHPFNEQIGGEAVADVFWTPLRRSFSSLQRRADVLLAGSVPDRDGVWVCEMGHLMGLFDRAWLGIPPTGRMAFNRYAEFSRVVEGIIVEQTMHVDVISIMRLGGYDPLPPQYGAAVVQPGPMTHDGLLYDEQPIENGEKTIALVDDMVSFLSAVNERADNRCTPQEMAVHWHNDMIWYGPAGIGSTYTIQRYQQQHQQPFRQNLHAKQFNGHIARFAEGDYACFFGWPNLTNRASGGFLGLPGNEIDADMRVVDVYRRSGDKLAENWVFIDVLHYLQQQGLDVLGRMSDQLTIPTEEAVT